MAVLLWLLLFLVWAPALPAATYYLSPIGNNANNGTAVGTPWQTFAYAIPRLVAGDTLNLVDGTYTTANSGMITITCGSNAANGSAGAGITLRALNERKAFIRGDGSGNPLQMYGCAYWTIYGLRLEDGDFPSEPGDYAGAPLVVRDSTHITVQRNLLRFTNRYLGGSGMYLRGSNNLIEENELYSYQRHGFQTGSLADGTNSTNNIYRRNYANSRAYGDISGGYPSANGETSKGDSGYIIYGNGGSTNNIFENNISEGNAGGYYLNAYYDVVSGTKFYGNISLGDSQGIYANGGPDASGILLNTLFQDHVTLNSTSFGWQISSAKGTICRNCTVIGAAQSALVYYNSNVPADGIYSFTGENLLIVNGTAGGFNIDDATHTWTVTSSNAYNNASYNYTPSSSSKYTNKLTTDPVLGGCLIYLPLASPMKTAGLSGADIGANVVYRTVNGTLTTTLLWDASTGAFPCGAIIAGVNDIAGSSCFDVHTRLHVTSSGCALPIPPTGVLPIPTNLRLGP